MDRTSHLRKRGLCCAILVLQVNSPTRGAHLISAIGDYGGFVHWDLESPCVRRFVRAAAIRQYHWTGFPMGLDPTSRTLGHLLKDLLQIVKLS